MAGVAFDSAFFVDVEVGDTVEVGDGVFDLGECLGVF